MRFETIDDVLGPGGGRFFGEGYRSVRANLEMIATSAREVTAYATVSYPAHWSSRSGRAREDAHLSSADALAIACRVTEAGFPDAASSAFVKKLTVRGGTSPTVSLRDIPVRVIREFAPKLVDESESWFRANVGGMKVEVHLAAVSARRIGHIERESFQASAATPNRLGNARLTLGPGFVDTDKGRAAANLAAGVMGELRSLDGRDASISVADFVASAGSLAQALLYELDAVSRDSVGNFWLRSASLSLPEPGPLDHKPQRLRAKVVRSRLLKRSSDTWRSARVNVKSNRGLNIEADVAYAL